MLTSVLLTPLLLAGLTTPGSFQTLALTQAPATQPAAPAADPSKPYTVPAGWTVDPRERPMRLATFKFGDGADAVEITLTQFPGEVGGLLANVNRWRGQIKLPPITQDQLATETTPFTVPGFQGHTMRLKGPEQHMLGAVLFEPAANRTWFVKATASPAALDKLEPSFLAFAKSFKTGQ